MSNKHPGCHQANNNSNTGKNIKSTSSFHVMFPLPVLLAFLLAGVYLGILLLGVLIN